MKKIIIIVGLCLSLAAASLLLLKFMGIGPFASTVDKKNDNIPLKSVFFNMKPITIPVIDGNEVAANLKLEIKLEAKIPKEKEDYQGSLREKQEFQKKLKEHKIEKLMPRIEDSFISDLHAFVPRVFKKYDRIDDPLLSKRLKVIAARQLEKNLIFNLTVRSKIEPPE